VEYNRHVGSIFSSSNLNFKTLLFLTSKQDFL
jgi:hypothetical protein